MNKKIFLVLDILWMGFIFYLSNQPADISSDQSGELIKMLSNLPIIGNVIDYMMKIDIAQFIVRKSAHMFAYFLLFILMFMYAYKNNKGVKKSYFIGFVATFLYACTDEIDQVFIEGRSGEIRDILVDSTGALIGMVLVGIILKIKKRV